MQVRARRLQPDRSDRLGIPAPGPERPP